MGFLVEIGCFDIFCHPNLTYNTFLESAGPGQYTGRISRHHVYHQGDQNGQECLLNGAFILFFYTFVVVEPFPKGPVPTLQLFFF